MWFSDAMRPALSQEEAAMQPANTSTLSGGAALNMIRMCQRENVETTIEVPVSAEQQTARNAVCAGQEPEARRNRAALYHVIRHSF